MWVGVHCWSAVSADEHVSCTSRLPVGFCSISGHACEGTRHAQTMHLPQSSSSVLQVEEATQTVCRPPTEHWRSAYCTCTPCIHTHTHTHTRARTHAHTITDSLCPLAMVNTSALWAQCWECETGAGHGSTDSCKCDSLCESESPHPGMWEGKLGSKGIPLIWLYKAAVRPDFALCPHSYRCVWSSLYITQHGMQ